MIPNVVEGANMTGLVMYLAGPGKANEHTNQHVVAGSFYVEMEFCGQKLQREDVLALARHIDDPRRMHDVDCRRSVKHVDTDTGEVSYQKVDAGVFHVSLSLSADEGELSDEKWAVIAHDYITRMGFGPDENRPGVRWAAIRHGASKNGNDHVHLAVSVVREDGAKVDLGRSFYRSQQVAGELERAHGLRVLETRRMASSTRGQKPAELVARSRVGAALTDREQLEETVRAVAVVSSDELAFVEGLRAAGVLVRPRFAKGSTSEAVGFSVAKKPAQGRSPVWYGGGSLARDLTLPRLRAGWGPMPAAVQQAAWKQDRSVGAVSFTEKAYPAASWDAAGVRLRQAAERLRDTPRTDHAAWASAAREVAGVYSAWSYRSDPAAAGPLRDVSRHLARSAGTRASTVRPATSTSPRLIAAQTGMLVMVASGQAPSDRAQMMLVQQLAGLARSVIEWQRAAGLAASAANAERALEDAVGAVTPAGGVSAVDAPKLSSEEQARARLRAVREAGYRAGHVGAPAESESERPVRRQGPGQGPSLGR